MSQANALTKDQIRAAGGIVHGDGNIFFTNIDQINSAIAALDLQRAMDKAIVIDWKCETKDPLAEFDAIEAECAQSYGRTPDAAMAKTMDRVRCMLFMWWGWHRPTLRAALVAAKAAA